MTDRRSQNHPQPQINTPEAEDSLLRRARELPVQATNVSPDDVESIGVAEAITELKLQEVAYRGALGTTERVLQPTLKDFLR